jgi:predicted metal-binding membrane protein
VKETELWQRLEAALGPGYYRVWAAEFSLAELGNRTVVQALALGTPSKTIWRAVWAALELPARDR